MRRLALGILCITVIGCTTSVPHVWPRSLPHAEMRCGAVRDRVVTVSKAGRRDGRHIRWHGSAILLDEDHLLTCRHILPMGDTEPTSDEEASDQWRFAEMNGDPILYQVCASGSGSTPADDWTVLRVRRVSTGAQRPDFDEPRAGPSVAFNGSVELTPGDEVVMIGYPLNGSPPMEGEAVPQSIAATEIVEAPMSIPDGMVAARVTPDVDLAGFPAARPASLMSSAPPSSSSACTGVSQGGRFSA